MTAAFDKNIATAEVDLRVVEAEEAKASVEQDLKQDKSKEKDINELLRRE
jgi:hypothetical protein